MELDQLFRNTDCERAILRLAGGDAEALELLYRCMNRKIYAVAYSVLRDCALADDVAQETYVKILENAFSYRVGTNAQAWVLSIARNLAIDLYRRRRFEIPTETECAASPRAFDEGDVLLSMEVKRALDLLNDEERQIVTLKVYAGLRHREIGALLGMTEENAKKKYQRALSTLRALLEKGGDA